MPETLSLTFQMKATEQYFSLVLFVVRKFCIFSCFAPMVPDLSERV